MSVCYNDLCSPEVLAQVDGLPIVLRNNFQHNMISAARFVGDEDHLPTPLEAGVFYKAMEDATVDTSAVSSPQSRHLVTFVNAAYECSLKDLINIMHYIYDLCVIFY